MRFTLSSLIAGFLLAVPAFAHAADSTYIGQEKRTIKALSEQEISNYLNGRGMGTSKAAELNHYPGPAHVLEQAEKLSLSAEQLAKTKKVHQVMAIDAVRLGKQIVQKEAELEALYAGNQANAENTRQVVDALARLQADYRLVHLNAHLHMRDILSSHQVAMYDRLRGYDGSKPQGAAHKHH